MAPPAAIDTMGPIPAPGSPHERREVPPDTAASHTAGDVARPTHRLADVQCGRNGVQLLVSTRDHVFDAKDVVAGDDSWQVMGAWSDESVPELTRMLSQRGSGASVGSSNTQPASRPQASTEPRFSGAGKRLGPVAEQSRGVSD